MRITGAGLSGGAVGVTATHSEMKGRDGVNRMDWSSSLVISPIGHLSRPW